MFEKKKINYFIKYFHFLHYYVYDLSTMNIFFTYKGLVHCASHFVGSTTVYLLEESIHCSLTLSFFCCLLFLYFLFYFIPIFGFFTGAWILGYLLAGLKYFLNNMHSLEKYIIICIYIYIYIYFYRV